MVGPNRKRFTIHEELAVRHSAPLGVLIRGQMGRRGKVAELDDIDEKTFVRFCEFAYTGNYRSAQHTARPREEEPNHGATDPGLPAPPAAVSKKRGSAHTQKACNHCGRGSEESPRKHILWAEFRQRYPSGSACCETRKNIEEGEDYTDVFLCHARVYAFAEKYDISVLRTLALAKLMRTLETFNVYGTRVRDIVCLAQYAYDNTRDSETGQDIDELRNLVVLYIVCAYENLANNTRFLALMEEGGPFASDLTRMIARRVALNKPDVRSV
jgi:hypothetical protein